MVYEPVKLVQEYRQFDFMSPWEGAEYILPGDEKTDARRARNDGLVLDLSDGGRDRVSDVDDPAPGRRRSAMVAGLPDRDRLVALLWYIAFGKDVGRENIR